MRLRGCALSVAKKYRTPLYDLKIDAQSMSIANTRCIACFIDFIYYLYLVNSELEKTGQFSWMDMKTDEDEHSIEMHLPYIAKVMEE